MANQGVARFLVVAATLLLPVCAAAQTELDAGDLRLTVDARGQITRLYDRVRLREHLAPGQPAPLVSVVPSGETPVHAGLKPDATYGASLPPTSAQWNARTRLLTLRFPGNVRVAVKAVARRSHAVLEVVDVQPAGSVDAIVWGPIPTSIGATVGEIVGVVRDEAFAIGLQVLDLKTRGGALLNDEGSDPSRGTLAQKTPWGSVLQAFALDRSRPRRVTGWNGQFPEMPVPPMPGETVIGSKVALFGCPPAEALQRIGAIEVAEGAPHPVFDGQWIKQWRDQGRSYLIAGFTEATFDELLACTRRANLMTLYHPEPFATWGHYALDPKMFPSGDEGMKRAVEKANALGVRIGVHTLTNFISTTDAYVSPVPDARLARSGSSRLVDEIDGRTTAIRVAAPEYFANEKANWLHTVVIDQELIRYRAVSSVEPWTLLDCERGAFGTKASAHQAGASVGKLIDHPYKVFFPNLDLQDEIAANLARWFNRTGVSQLDFDGREGCLASGQGDYAQDRFAEVFYRNLDHPVVNGTSTSSPYYWHINSYCNWGEPWYGGFRESMQEYRIDNQALFDRNYVPNMLGWYRLTATTSLAEMEWMLARAAGFGAGFAMSTTIEELRRNPDTALLLDTIREWEAARRSHAFTPAQRERLRNSKLEFHLEPVRADAGRWRLYPFHDSPVFRQAATVRQPGEPVGATWTVENPDEAQPLQFRLQAVGGSGAVSRFHIEVDRSRTIAIDAELKGGESLVCDGTAVVRIYDAKGRQRDAVVLSNPAPRLSTGAHAVVFDCTFGGETAPAVEVTFRTRGASEAVPSTPST
jgi:hypothetical protein